MDNTDKLKLKVELLNAMEVFLNRATENVNDIGHVPYNTVAYMADSAFLILETVIDANNYFLNNDLLK